MLVPIFIPKKSVARSLSLLFRKKSHSVHLLGCKRSRDDSLSLPTFRRFDSVLKLFTDISFATSLHWEMPETKGLRHFLFPAKQLLWAEVKKTLLLWIFLVLSHWGWYNKYTKNAIISVVFAFHFLSSKRHIWWKGERGRESYGNQCSVSKMRKHKGAIIQRIQQAWVFIHALVWDLVFDMDHVQMGDWIDDIFLLRLVDGDCA